MRLRISDLMASTLTSRRNDFARHGCGNLCLELGTQLFGGWIRCLGGVVNRRHSVSACGSLNPASRNRFAKVAPDRGSAVTANTQTAAFPQLPRRLATFGTSDRTTLPTGGYKRAFDRRAPPVSVMPTLLSTQRISWAQAAGILRRAASAVGSHAGKPFLTYALCASGRPYCKRWH